MWQVVGKWKAATFQTLVWFTESPAQFHSVNYIKYLCTLSMNRPPLERSRSRSRSQSRSRRSLTKSRSRSRSRQRRSRSSRHSRSRSRSRRREINLSPRRLFTPDSRSNTPLPDPQDQTPFTPAQVSTLFQMMWNSGSVSHSTQHVQPQQQMLKGKLPKDLQFRLLKTY